MRRLIIATTFCLAAGPLAAQERERQEQGASREEALGRLAEKHGVAREELARIEADKSLGREDASYAVAVAGRALRSVEEVAALRRAGTTWNEICRRFELDYAQVRREAQAFAREAREAGFFMERKRRRAGEREMKREHDTLRDLDMKRERETTPERSQERMHKPR